jgi:hypothetical protein
MGDTIEIHRKTVITDNKLKHHSVSITSGDRTVTLTTPRLVLAVINLFRKENRDFVEKYKK